MEKELKLKTAGDTHTTEIRFGIDFVLEKRLPEIVEETEKKVVVITDNVVEKLVAPKIDHLDLTIFSFPAGESSKSRETKSMLEDALLSHHFGKDSLLISLGGGVVGDVGGFVAATYCRGIPLIQIPTTLLGMVDAAIGGKTGVNTPYGKNMIGAFHPPNEVLIDGAFLSTLPEEEWTNGVAELLKAGLIASPELFNSLRDEHHKWEARDLSLIMQQIFHGVDIKRDIVEEDPFEQKGIRRILNFGHTIGHALERLENYEIRHGSAIAIGMLVSCYISEKMGLLESSAFAMIRETIEQYKIPLVLPREYTLDELIQTLAIDKKSLKTIPRLVLLNAIGSVHPFDGEYCSEVDFPLLDEAISWMHSQFVKGHG